MKKLLLLSLTIFLISQAFCFDWPQENVTKDSYSSYFGQNQGGKISSSLIFSEPGEIKAAENGYILAIMIEQSDDSSFFPSTLGTSVILSHEDNLLSVYGNIDKDTITLNDKNEKMLDIGATIGLSGSTGWQSETSHLEFQIIDTKNKTTINPKVLMPRAEVEIPLTLNGVYIQNKNLDLFDINTYKTYNSGLYRIYQKRNNVAAPYKTAVSVNGVIVDQISYDTIIQENNTICIMGKKKYTSADIYPNETLQLIGEVMFTPGRATLGLIDTDFLGNVKQVNYNIVIR